KIRIKFFHAYAWEAKIIMQAPGTSSISMEKEQLNLHRRGSPRLGVEDKARLLKIPESSRYTWLLTHNVTQEAKVPESPRYT
ncbi:hypothetical protein PIB30_112854, partial [Stylosanthes scabra]|nr:hypothetical protein [Stylosanthes scabra]